MPTLTGSRRRRATATIAARLTLEQLGKAYGPVEALKSVDLDVEPGEVVSILGHSGCGKTTLLRLAAGVEVPSRGRVLIDNQESSSRSLVVPPEKRNVGLIFQDHALFPHLTILKNVMFGLAGLDEKVAEKEAHTALERVGLDHLAKAYPHETSGGEQQRVALARATVTRPGILLMDEPFSSLDARLRDSVRSETLAVLRETGATAVIVTHDPEEAMQLSDRIALMRAGEMVQVGEAEQLYHRPNSLFAARFFSPLNELDAVASDGLAVAALGAFPTDLARNSDALVVAVRPQDVQLHANTPSQEGVLGRIVSRRFLGEVDHFHVAVEGLDTYLVARRRSSDGAGVGAEMDVGAEVKVYVDPSTALVFSRNEIGT